MGVSSGAIRAGRAFVELFTNDSKLVQGLQLAEARVKRFGAMMARAGAAIAAAGASVKGPLEIARQYAISNGSEVAGLAKNLSTTSEELTAFGYAASKSGVAFSGLVGYLDSLPEKLSNLADGAGEGADLLRRLGIPARDLINMGFEDRMAMIADRVQRVVSPIDRARVATELFGAAGRDLLPFLEKGGDAYRKLAAEAKATGQVITTDQANRAAQAARALTSAYESLRGILIQVGAALIPTAQTISDLSTRFQAVATAVRSFVQDNQSLISLVAGVATAFVVAGTALAGLGIAVSAVGAGLGAIASVVSAVGGLLTAGVVVAFKALVIVLGAILSPIGLVVAGVVAAGAALVYFTDTGRNAFNSFYSAARSAIMPVIEYFQAMLATFEKAWKGIKAAITDGNFTGAFSVLVASLNVEWSRFMVVLTDGWNRFKNLFVDNAYRILTYAKLVWNDVKAAFLTALGGMIEGLEKIWAKSNGFIDFLKNLFVAAGDFVKDYIGNALESAALRGKAAFLDMTSSWQNALKSLGFIAAPGAAAALALIDRNKEEIKDALLNAGNAGADALRKLEEFRDRKANELGEAAGQGAKQIEANRVAEAMRIMIEASKAMEARKASRAADSQDARDRLEQAQKALDEAISKVTSNAIRQAGLASIFGGAAATKDAGSGQGKAQNKLGFDLPALARGTFSGANAGQFFAAPSIANRQLTEQVKANTILEKIEKNTEQLGERKAVFK